LIREAGEQVVRGDLGPFRSELPGLAVLFVAHIGCPRRLCPWEPTIFSAMCAERLIAMVALAVPRFGMIVEVNLARSYLFRAHTALEAGSVFEAGVLLREAIRRQLVAECNWYGCLPKGSSTRTPAMVLLKALRSALGCQRGDYEWMGEMIDIANRCCHAQHVTAGQVELAITVIHQSIDNDPCGEPRFRLEHCLPLEPSVEANADYDVDDCDDDDRRKADWWKPGDWAPEL
jgi:hypothetical protein